MTTPQQMRDKNIALLNQRGFKPATWMPLPAAVGDVSEETGFAGGTLRPEMEIATRLLCHCAVFAWGSAPSEFEQRVTQFITNNELRRSMTDSELHIIDLSMDDARADYAHLVGWRLENMWSLAWILGVAEEPSATNGQLSEETSGALLSLFLPGFTATAESLLSQGQTQSVETVIEMEDRFYLAHNAVRSGQLGKAGMLPDDFDPVADGGAIHERRHSLTWSLAPEAEWDETDLST